MRDMRDDPLAQDLVLETVSSIPHLPAASSRPDDHEHPQSIKQHRIIIVEGPTPSQSSSSQLTTTFIAKKAIQRPSPLAHTTSQLFKALPKYEVAMNEACALQPLRRERKEGSSQLPESSNKDD